MLPSERVCLAIDLVACGLLTVNIYPLWQCLLLAFYYLLLLYINIFFSPHALDAQYKVFDFNGVKAVEI